ncbi:aconitate hydratase AcnA [Rickettsiales endosymbiont of Stachyamoeba lipophora]|uniref:aconitate hydratase AcnA n=1 Tax=Rickettsiales endosymbiont of Stachyamoeba lipophora TaxID=2486578 RepID=UPI000F646AF8|nr:aconitate hydratase AcnA [Rickettsiales endosymbiont of Stachyamoeba lipophora]AZL16317.1 aconitate hydratase AcnA [Rickettsiales endosymbiont of Stachyamoeba lipophora]
MSKASQRYLKNFHIEGVEYNYYDLKQASDEFNINLDKLPYSLRILFENLLRNYDEVNVTKEDFIAIKNWIDRPKAEREIAFSPARVLMQDFTGVPAVVDLAAMRDAMKNLKGNPDKINPLVPVDLVIDHSVQVDYYGNHDAFKQNVTLEMHRNDERYQFLKWGQEAFNNFKVVPPGTGICHQVNLEYLAKVVWTKQEDSKTYAYPDTLVGTDSHTTMVNGLAVLGWGVGGIEAEAAMLGQPISMLLPEVVGFKLTGKLREGTTATDLVLTVTQMLRKKGVVNKFVEFYGAGLDNLSLADRATIANMAPEYGATCGFFPVDQETIKYLELTARDSQTIKLVEQYCKLQNLWRNNEQAVFSDSLELDLASVEASLAGPKRPQDKVLLSQVRNSIISVLPELSKSNNIDTARKYAVKNQQFSMANTDVAIAAITSCTNTSNPSVMIAAGLVAKKALEKGINVKPWVKTSLAPGSKVVSEYLEKSGLQEYLNQMGFNLVGYGCTTCIGNSGPLLPEIEECIIQNEMIVASVLSGNRNFEGRVHPLVKANYLASPPLVVAYAIAGTTNIDLTTEPIAQDENGNDVYLRDLWPTHSEIEQINSKFVNSTIFKAKYAEVFKGDQQWQNINTTKSQTYNWHNSTYINNPPYFVGMGKEPGKVTNINHARILAIFGDSITTDHISPAGNIAKNSPAAKYLVENGIEQKDFNSYGARRGNHEVMMRGTFANIRIKNEMLPGTEGGVTKHHTSSDVISIYDAAMKYKEDNTPLVVFAGKEYGTGSSRDWAAKGTLLLGIKAVIAESFERIHRSNLIGMGILPLMFQDGITRKELNLSGDELVSIVGLEGKITPKMLLKAHIQYKDNSTKEVELICRIDTQTEVEYYNNNGILPYVLRGMKG